MQRKLFIHTGVHRTATTSIQGFLRKNIDPLVQNGILNFNSAGRNVYLFNQVFAGGFDVSEIAKRISHQADKRGDIHSVILSDEDVCMRADLSVLQKFSELFDVHILLSMRRQDLWLESWHQQNVKWQWNPLLSHLTFPEFLNRRDEFHWIHYDRIVAHLEALFGKENLHLRVFEKGEMPKGPIAAFCEDIGLTDLTGFLDAPHANASLSPVFSEFMRMMPLDEIPPQLRSIIERAVAKTHAQAARQYESKPSSLLMDHATRVDLLSEFSVGNAAVAQAYLGRGELFLEPLPPVDAPLASQTLPTDSYALMQDFVSPMVREIGRELEVIQKAQSATGGKK